MTYRVLLVGSKDWEDVDTILGALEELAVYDDVTMVYGHTVLGAGSIAAEYAYKLGWTLEPHDADWGLFDKMAGQVRDAAMVVDGADICLAFIKDQSRDATRCAQYARESGIKTIVYTQTGDVLEGSFNYCPEMLTFGEAYLYCDKEAKDNHEEHRGIGHDDEGKLYMMSWRWKPKHG